jgi:hypothetical protein
VRSDPEEFRNMVNEHGGSEVLIAQVGKGISFGEDGKLLA